MDSVLVITAISGKLDKVAYLLDLPTYNRALVNRILYKLSTQRVLHSEVFGLNRHWNWPSVRPLKLRKDKCALSGSATVLDSFKTQERCPRFKVLGLPSRIL
jgi:hypothetical protein